MSNEELDPRVAAQFGLTRVSKATWAYQGAVAPSPASGMPDIQSVGSLLSGLVGEMGSHIEGVCLVSAGTESIVVLGFRDKGPMAIKTLVSIRTENELKSTVAGLVKATQFTKISLHVEGLLLLQRG